MISKLPDPDLNPSIGSQPAWSPLEVTAWAGSLVAAAATLLLLCALATRGFDLTDESFYLLSYQATGGGQTTWFDLVLGTIYAACRGDLAGIRLAGFGITLTVWSCAVFGVLRWGDPYRSRRILAVAAIPSIFLCYFDPFLATPSYNTLVAWGAGLVVAGLAWALSTCRTATYVLSAATIGSGVAITGFGKPPAGLLLGVLALAALGWTRRWLAFAVVPFALVVVAALVILPQSNGQPWLDLLVGPWRYMTQVASDDRRLSFVLAPSRFSELVISWRYLFAAFMVATTLFITYRYRPRSWRGAVLLALGVAGIAGGVALIHGAVGRVCLTVVVALLIVRWLHAGARAPSAAPLTKRPDAILAAVLFVIPVACVIGTNNSYARAMSHLCGFWVLLILLAMGWFADRWWRHSVFPVVALLVSFSTTGAVIRAGWKPYRSDVPLFKLTATCRLASTDVSVSKPMAHALMAFRNEADAGGWIPQTPVIDATGAYPGLVFSLGGKPVGHAWVCAGFPYSTRWFDVTLTWAGDAPCAGAWLLAIEGPGGSPRFPLGADVLTAHGCRLEEYRPVARFADTRSRTAVLLLRPSE